MEFYFGTSGFAYNEWKGKFYPEKISEKKMLPFYAKQLTTVEINSTFYRMPTMNVVKLWSSEVPNGFIFAVKAPQIITHIKRLENVSGEARYFFTTLSGLGKKLGPVLFQFPASFRQDVHLLEKFLAHIPPNVRCAFDFRSDTWFNEKTYGLLKRMNYAICMEDTDEKPVKDLISTAPWGYLRLRKADYSRSQLRQWAKKIASQKWKKVFVFFKHDGDVEAKAPAFAADLRKLCLRLGNRVSIHGWEI